MDIHNTVESLLNLKNTMKKKEYSAPQLSILDLKLHTEGSIFNLQESDGGAAAVATS
jgi:hypothetical protein